MATATFKLFFEDPFDHGRIGSPLSYVTLADRDRDHAGNILVSVQAMGFQELSDRIDELQAELEEIRRVARDKYREHSEMLERRRTPN